MNFLPHLSPRALGAVVIVLALVASSASASASGTSAAAGTVLVLPVGDSSDVVLLQNNAAAPLREAGLGVSTLDDAKLAGFDAERAVQCLDADEECDDLLRKAPAEWVLLLRIRHSGKNQSAADKDADQTVIAKLYAATDSSLLQVEQRLCQRCGSRERMARLTMQLIAEVVNAELANQATETYINVTSTPANAILSIDGTVVGPTGQAYRVTPGEHQVAVQLDGYRPASQTVTVKANEHKALTVGLGSGSAGSGSGTGRRILTWASIGSGLAALGAGVGWMVIDDNSVSSGNSRDEVRDTMILGISSMVAGSVLLGAGVALLLTDSDGTHKMQMSAAPLADGMSIGVSGHF